MAEPEEGGAQAAPATAKRRKTVTGTVHRTKMQKTITVDVVRLERHPKYDKYVRRSTRFHAHDERGEAHVGDVVKIAETRPISKTKRWRLVEIVRPASGVESIAGEGAPEEGEA